jgi:hypothetical protein
LCERLISGRMIDVRQDARGAYHLHCPTPGCPASARDWFYHGACRMRTGRVTKTAATFARDQRLARAS